MRENKILEYKETIESNTFLETVSAFTNYRFGSIIFGVSDDGNISGVKSCLSIENKINDNIIILEVYEGMFKPYLYRGNSLVRLDYSIKSLIELSFKLTN